MTYIKLFVDYLDAIEPLGDAERGRLFTALLEYAKTGEAPQLGGNERFLFPMMRAQIDRDEADYQDFIERQTENGKKGGRPKNPKNPPLLKKPTATQKSQDKDKDKDKDKDNKENSPPYGGESKKTTANAAAAAVCADFLDRINPTASQNCLDELSAFAEAMGEAVCKRAFDIALDAKKASWPYIRAILQDKRAKGVKCLADWEAADRSRGSGKDAQKQDFQPSAERIRKNNEWLSKFLEEQEEKDGGGT